MTDFDPEAEQEVDFARYGRVVGARWWVPVAALVVGAVIGYAVSLGGSQTFKATATLYLGQPYSASGTVQLQAAQTNPSTVKQIVHAVSVDERVAGECKAKMGQFRGGISTQRSPATSRRTVRRRSSRSASRRRSEGLHRVLPTSSRAS